MQITIERQRLIITPLTSIERAYIEDTLGLIENGDSISLVRVGEDYFYLETKRD